jgi:UDP-N-acetyl-2-amino-2-deoxyglucuronate dehydrogenase
LYKAALIGCGRISFKHIEGYVKNSKKLSLMAVCDPDLERAEEKKNEYLKSVPSVKILVFSDYLELLSSKDRPDIVTIATESGNHPQIAIDCLNAGCHVIVEKPMALSTKDADAMIEAADRNNKKLAVCFQNRFNAPVQKTREALDQGRFGGLLHSMIQVRWNRNEGYYSQAPWRGTWALDGGTLMNQCTHGIDLLQWFGGPVKRIHGVTRRFQRPIEAEDFGGAILEFQDGSVGMIEATANVFPTNLNETLSLFGRTGSVVIGGLAVNKLETWRFSDSDVVGDGEEKVINPLEKDPPTVYGFGHAALFADFIDAIENDREPLINGSEGRKAMEIILGIYKSMKTGGSVDLPWFFLPKI